MSRKTVLLVAAALAVLGTTGTVLALATRGGKTETKRSNGSPPVKVASTKKTYAELVAANYKILKPAQTKKLLAYADAFYDCLSKQIDIGAPKPSPTKIVMALPRGAKPAAVARLGIRCAIKIGDPPRNASLQVRPHAEVLYLPKYCILDRKTELRTAPLPQP
jgi:hypothetical protein